MTSDLVVASVWIASCTLVDAAATFAGPGAATAFASAVPGCCGAGIHVISRLSGRRLRWRYAGVPITACTNAVFPLARRSVREPGDIVQAHVTSGIVNRTGPRDR